MNDSLQRALVSVRASAEKTGGITLYARSHQASIGKGWSFDIAEPQLTGAEMMLGALAADILGLFTKLVSERRLSVDEVEAKLTAQLAAPLALLGVIGASGEPYYEAIQFRAYIGSSANPGLLQTTWDDALKRAPFFNTLRRSTKLDIVMQMSA